MYKIGVIILARMTSSRLPGKVMKKIGGKPLIGHLIDNIRSCNKDLLIVVATSIESEDDELVNYLSSCNVNTFRGDLNNVARRFLLCAEHYNLDYAIRTNADNFIFPSNLLSRILESIKRNESIDFYSNVVYRTFPAGYSIECIKVKVFKNEIANFSDYDEEHVMTYFYKINTINYKYFFNQNPTHVKLAIDTKEDFDNLKKRNELHRILHRRLSIEEIIELW